MRAEANILSKFERLKILQVYFTRISGRVITEIPVEYRELYDIDLPVIKKFLMGILNEV